MRPPAESLIKEDSKKLYTIRSRNMFAIKLDYNRFSDLFDWGIKNHIISFSIFRANLFVSSHFFDMSKFPIHIFFLQFNCI